MLEIKISIDDALLLLLERMKLELRIRQKTGKIPAYYSFEQIGFNNLKSIVDAAIFDTIILLPIELLTTETNLKSIIASTVQALAKSIRREEFFLFSHKNAHRLISPVIEQFQNQLKENNFQQN